MKLRKKLGQPLLKLAIAHNTMLEMVQDDDDMPEELGQIVYDLGLIIDRVDQCRIRSEEKEHAESVSWQRHSLNS